MGYGERLERARLPPVEVEVRDQAQAAGVDAGPCHDRVLTETIGEVEAAAGGRGTHEYAVERAVVGLPDRPVHLDEGEAAVGDAVVARASGVRPLHVGAGAGADGAAARGREGREGLVGDDEGGAAHPREIGRPAHRFTRRTELVHVPVGRGRGVDVAKRRVADRAGPTNHDVAR